MKAHDLEEADLHRFEVFIPSPLQCLEVLDSVNETHVGVRLERLVDQEEDLPAGKNPATSSVHLFFLDYATPEGIFADPFESNCELFVETLETTGWNRELLKGGTFLLYFVEPLHHRLLVLAIGGLNTRRLEVGLPCREL